MPILGVVYDFLVCNTRGSFYKRTPRSRIITIVMWRAWPTLAIDDIFWTIAKPQWRWQWRLLAVYLPFDFATRELSLEKLIVSASPAKSRASISIVVTTHFKRAKRARSRCSR
jgi:hypothetical protein